MEYVQLVEAVSLSMSSEWVPCTSPLGIDPLAKKVLL